MFGIFKRRTPITLELDAATIDAMFNEANSPEEREYERISEYTSDLLDTLRSMSNVKSSSGRMARHSALSN